MGESVLDIRVRGHFAAAVGAGPVLGSGEELAADALPAVSLVDIPALDVADRVGCVAAVGVGAKAGFEEPDEAVIGRFGDEMEERQGRRVAPGQGGGELLPEFFARRFGPECMAEVGEGFEVGGKGGPDAHLVRVPRGRAPGSESRGWWDVSEVGRSNRWIEVVSETVRGGWSPIDFAIFT